MVKSSGVILPSGERAHDSRTTFSTRSISRMTCTDEQVSQFPLSQTSPPAPITNVVESDALGVRDLARVEQLGQVLEFVKDRVAQLVPREFVDDPAEVALVDVAVLVLVKVPERLPESLALKTLHQLRELAVGQSRFSGGEAAQGGRVDSLEPDDVSTVRLAEIERTPRAIKVEWDRVWPSHRLKDLLELVELDLAVTVLVKDPEGNLTRRRDASGSLVRRHEARRAW